MQRGGPEQRVREVGLERERAAIVGLRAAGVGLAPLPREGSSVLQPGVGRGALDRGREQVDPRLLVGAVAPAAEEPAVEDRAPARVQHVRIVGVLGAERLERGERPFVVTRGPPAGDASSSSRRLFVPVARDAHRLRRDVALRVPAVGLEVVLPVGLHPGVADDVAILQHAVLALGAEPVTNNVSAWTLLRVCSFGNSFLNCQTSPPLLAETRVRPAFSRSTISMNTFARP